MVLVGQRLDALARELGKRGQLKEPPRETLCHRAGQGTTPDKCAAVPVLNFLSLL
jgi:hypothetical protein